MSRSLMTGDRTDLLWCSVLSQHIMRWSRDIVKASLVNKPLSATLIRVWLTTPNLSALTDQLVESVDPVHMYSY